MPLADVQHQPRALVQLARAMAATKSREEIAHAFLFAGPDGVGKRMLAERFARVLLCESPVEATTTDSDGNAIAHREACGACDACRWMAAGTHPDFHSIHRSLKQFSREDRVRRSRGVELSVDVIREFLIDRAGEKSHVNGWKVFVVDEADRMSIGAQNALLKTLEEPPPRTVLILLTENADRLLPTTLSRCQRVPFTPLPEEFVVEVLTARPEVVEPQDEATARFLARQTNGSIGQSVALVEEGIVAFKRDWLERLLAAGSNRQADPERGLPELLKRFDEVCNAFASVLQERDPDASKAESQRDGARRVFAVLTTLLRDGLWLQAGGDGSRVIHADQPQLAEQAAARWPRETLLAHIDEVRATEAKLASNVNVPLAIEVLLNGLTR